MIASSPSCDSCAPLTRFVAPWRAHAKDILAWPAFLPPPVSAHPSRASWLHRELHRRPQWQGSHSFLLPCRPTLHTFRATWEASPKARRARFTFLPPPMSGTPLHVLWPHTELHRRPLRQGSRSFLHTCEHTPHALRGPIGSSTESPNGRAGIPSSTIFGEPLIRLISWPHR